MTAPFFDICAIGNAIVDVIADANDAFLTQHEMAKGAMILIDEDKADGLFNAMAEPIACSGGSAANTAVGVRALGGRAAYVGKLHKDELGARFRDDIRATGVYFDTPPTTDGPATARCLILVTSDAQRTMNTYIGACAMLSPADVDEGLIAASKLTYLEGYQWDAPLAQEAMVKACDLARKHGRQVALTLSDAFCVDRHRDAFRALVADKVNVLFANESEICSLYQVESFDDALQAVRGQCDLAVLTRSEKGAVILAGGDVHLIDAAPVKKVVDTTGAGDLYAAGFLAGYARTGNLHRAGKMGAIAAAEVISHYGARPQADLAKLVQDKLG